MYELLVGGGRAVLNRIIACSPWGKAPADVAGRHREPVGRHRARQDGAQ